MNSTGSDSIMMGDDAITTSTMAATTTMTVFTDDSVMEAISEIMYPTLRLIGAGLVVWLSSVGSR